MKTKVETVDGRQVLREGAFQLGQTADGTLLFASDPALFTAASEPSERYTSLYALPTKGDASWIASEAFVKAAAKSGSGLPPELGQLGRVSGSLDLRTGQADTRIDCPTEADATKLAGAIVFAKAGFEDELKKNAPPAVAAALMRINAKAEGKAVIVGLALPNELLELGAKLAAEQLRTAMAKP
jgi:hypothetical protein